jgi:NAD(P)H dehydrogenase (quinone)
LPIPARGVSTTLFAETAVSGLREAEHTVTVHDLYAEQFDPLLLDPEIARDATLPPLVAVHCREIATADGIVIVHPNWWGMPPAILKRLD